MALSELLEQNRCVTLIKRTPILIEGDEIEEAAEYICLGNLVNLSFPSQARRVEERMLAGIHSVA